MTTPHLAVGAAHGGQCRQVLALVAYIPRESDDVLRLGASGVEDGQDVLEGLSCLLDEIVAGKMAFNIPADLTGNEHHFSTRENGVSVALWSYPARRLDRASHAWVHSVSDA